MKLRELLQKKGSDVVTISDSSSLGESLELLNSRKIGALVVLGKDKKVAGIITERDILHLCGRAGKPVESVVVGDVMTKDLLIAVPDDTVEYAMGIMTNNRIRHLPVMENNALAGIISIGDLVKSQLESLEQENRYLKQFILQS